MIDIWLREKRPNNIILNDPKGELLNKFYVPAAVRGFEVVQFNLMEPMKTDIYNPLMIAADAARNGDFTNAQAYVENIGDIFFPKDAGDDPMWNNAANNSFKRCCYGLIDYFLEEEKEIRKKAILDGTHPKVVEQKINDLWGQCTLYNAYQFFVILSSKKSSNFFDVCLEGNRYDAEVENRATAEDTGQSYKPPAVKEVDYFTLFFDATDKLPKNSMRTAVSNADKSLRAMAGSDKTIASVYGIALTAMSFFTDPTISTLTSGKMNQNFDPASLSFPRRFGVRFDAEYMEKYKIVGIKAEFKAYSDSDFTKELGKEFNHVGIIGRDGWARSYFDGKFKNMVNYVKLSLIDPSSDMVMKNFYFKLTLNYRTTLDGRGYVLDPITNEKIVKDGFLEEMVINRKPKKDEEQKFNEEMNSEGSKPKSESEKYVIGNSYMKVAKKIEFWKNDGKETVVNVPVFSQKEVHYVEKPKLISFITPPHLTPYAKLILILIKQMADINFQLSYTIKGNQKPLYKTRY